MELSQLKWNAMGLVTVVVQDRLTGEVRMLAHANLQAIERTLSTGLAHFYSRSRAALWCKGESSGNTLAVHSVYADCDGDALVYLVDPAGPTCHTGQPSCFFRPLSPSGQVADAPEGAAMSALPALWHTLQQRMASPDSSKSYTRKLLNEGPKAIAAKVEEEGEEFARALCGESKERLVSEGADVLYHLLVGLLARGASLREVEAELARRFGVSGLEEKARRGVAPQA